MRATPAKAKITSKPGVPVVRALDRGIAVLRAFTALKPRRTLTEIAAVADLDKGTARRLLHTLVLNGLVDHDERSALYSLAAGVLELASAVETGRELKEIAAPHLAEIAEHCGATAFLWIYHDGAALCIDRAKPSVPAIDASWFAVGARTALNCGGGPRVLLAFLAPEEQELALSLPLVKRTPNSQTDKRRLTREAEGIRRRGWEFISDDFALGLSALAVPVFDQEKRLVGSISITSVTAHLVANGRPRHLDVLLRSAREIGAKML